MAGVPARERGSIMGTVSTFFDAAQGLGAALAGGLAALTSYRGAFAGGAVSCALAFVLLRTRVRDAGPAPEPDEVAVAIASGEG
jgi:predicted MFS family arabinose efflux permease